METQKTQVISVMDPQAIIQIEALFSDLWASARYEAYYQVFRDCEAAVYKHRSELQVQYPLILERYEDLFCTIRWRCFHRLSIQEIESQLYQDPSGFVNIDFDDALRSIRSALMIEPVREDRDIAKQRLRDAMARSSQYIGKTRIQVADSLVDPTLKNWIKDFKIFLGDRIPNSLALVEYISSSPNIAQLPKETIESVKILFKLYIELYKSSLTPEGAEDKLLIADPVTGKYKLFDAGQLNDTGVAVPDEELVVLRDFAGLDALGNPLPISQLFHRTAAFQAYARQVLVERGIDLEKEETEKQIIRNEDIVQSQSGIAISQPVLANLSAQSAVAEPLPQESAAASQEAKPSMPSSEETPRPTMRVVASPFTPSPWKMMDSAPIPKKNASSELTQPSTTASAPSQSLDLSSKELAQYVLRETGSLLPTAEAEKRCLSVLVHFFDSAMRIEELRDELTKVKELGGVGLSIQEAQRMLVVAQRLRKSDFSIPQVKVPTPKPKIHAPSIASLQKAMNVGTKKTSTPPSSTQQKNEPEDIFGNLDAASGSGTAAWNMLPQQMRDVSPVKRGPTVVRAGQMPAVMGPLDELSAMTLDEFRRLSPQPQEAVKHIANQLTVLEEESPAQKAAGIQAWGQSPLNQLYLRIGRESLDRMLSIDDVIRAQQERKEPTLSLEEFEAIADFNRTLRF